MFVVDATDHSKIQLSKDELHTLIKRQQLAGIPLLVLGNKNDMPGALNADGIIEALDLKSVEEREVACYSVSAKNKNNIDMTMQWLIKHAKNA